jgi:hypothetical protein
MSSKSKDIITFFNNLPSEKFYTENSVAFQGSLGTYIYRYRGTIRTMIILLKSSSGKMFNCYWWDNTGLCSSLITGI